VGDLKDGLLSRRLYAARALGNQPVADTQVLKALEVVSKNDDDPVVRAEATVALKKLGSKPLAQWTEEELKSETKYKQWECHHCGKWNAGGSYCRYCGKSMFIEDINSVSREVESSPSILQKESPQSTQPVKSRSTFWPALVIGLLLAVFAGIPSLLDMSEYGQSVLQGQGSIAWLRGMETDLLIHFATNWVIWTIVAAIVITVWRNARDAP
jgi:ribosomal protein L37AE/L43A